MVLSFWRQLTAGGLVGCWDIAIVMMGSFVGANGPIFILEATSRHHHDAACHTERA